MERVLLKRLTIENFKGLKFFELKPNDDVTAVCGRNRSGKSTIADAFMWLLFGKNQKGVAQFAIMPRNTDTSVVEHIKPTVTGVFDVNGVEMELQRQFVQRWVNDKYDGNDTKCFKDGRGIGVKEYQAVVDDIVNFNVFKLLTNPLEFFRMKWDEQRSLLMNIAGVSDSMTDDMPKAVKDIVKTNTIDESMQGLANKIKKNESEQKECDIIIRNNNKRLAQGTTKSLEDAQAQKTEVEKLLEDVEAELKGGSDAIKVHNAKIQVFRDSIKAKEQQIKQLIEAAQKKEYDRVKELNKGIDQLSDEINKLSDNIRNKKKELDAAKDEQSKLHKEVESKRTKLQDISKQFDEVSARQFTRATCLICPITNEECCDEALCLRHTNEQTELMRKFNTNKADELRKLNEEGVKIKGEGEVAAKQEKEAVAKVEKIEAELKALESDKTAKIDESNTMNYAIANILNEADVPECEPVRNEIKRMETEMENIENQSEDTEATTELVEKKKALMETRDAIVNDINLYKDTDKQNERIAELQKDIIDLKREKKVLTDYTEGVYRATEEAVNKMFSVVHFKLFEYNYSSEEAKPTCTPSVNGTPIDDVNSADVINAGLDIINTLVAYYGINVPVFIDNAESVNQFIHVNSQLILMKVTEDATLRVE